MVIAKWYSAEVNPSEYEKVTAGIAHRLTNYTDLAKYGTIRYGKSNKWLGAARWEHQIDVSILGDREILLVECKCWSDNVEAEAFLTMWGRVMDISKGPIANGRKVRGALVTTKDFQSGVYQLANHYNQEMSLFVVKSVDDFVDLFVKCHRHFIEPSTLNVDVIL